MQPRNSSSFEDLKRPQKSTAVLQFFFTKPPSPSTHTHVYIYIYVYIYILQMIVDSISQVVYIMIYLPSTNHSFKIFRWIVVRWFVLFQRRRGTWPRRAPATRPTAPRWCHRDPSRVSRMSPPRRNGGWDFWRTKAQGTKKNHEYPLVN